MLFDLIILGLVTILIYNIVRICMQASDSPPPPKPKEVKPPRFTVEIETCVVDIQQPEKKVSKFLVERGYLDPIKHTQEVLRVYIRDTNQHYYDSREQPPFAQVSLSDPDFDTKVREAHALAEDRCSTLEALNPAQADI